MQKYVFANAYGGAVESDSPPQIHEYMVKLRREIGSLGAKKQPGGPMFPVKSAKELNQKLAEALDYLGMVAAPIKQEVVNLDVATIPKNETKSGNPVFRTLMHCITTVRIIAPDCSFLDVVGSGHGGDTDDKAGGKASTFSWKDAILKGLTVPHEDMVDTDDDSTVEPVKFVPPSATTRRAMPPAQSEPSVPDSDEVGEPNPKDLEYTLLQIGKAKTQADLEQIREAIKAGVLSLHGQDKLSASKAFVKKAAEIKRGEPDTNA